MKSGLKVEDLARIAHEANRAYCRGIYDYSHKSWDDTPQEIKDTTIAGVEFLINNPSVSPSDMHNNWCKDKASKGWKYGPRKDVENKLHPCMVEYLDLSEEQRLKDSLFSTIIKVFL